jgi:hypothetical protein
MYTACWRSVRNDYAIVNAYASMLVCNLHRKLVSNSIRRKGGNREILLDISRGNDSVNGSATVALRSSQRR